MQSVETFEDLKDVLAKADLETWVVFDVDEVLISPANTVQRAVAGLFWAKNCQELERRLGRKRFDELYSIILMQSEFSLTHHELPDAIATVQKRGVITCALTACWTGNLGKIPSLEQWRENQLREAGISFNHSLWDGLNGPLETLSSPRSVDAVFHQGILFSADFSKGLVLDAFFQKVRKYPRRLLFVDDREYNFPSMAQVCQKWGIEMIGVHDRRAAIATPPFSEEIGRLQLEKLVSDEVWLTDAAAAALFGPL